MPGRGASTLLIGPSLHLWFLPFAFLGGLGLRRLGRLVGRASFFRPLSVGALFGMVFAITARLHGSLISPFGQWLVSAPMLVLGALVVHTPSQRERGFLFAAAAIGTVPFLESGSGLATMIAIPTCWFVLGPERPELKTLKRLGDLSFGVYLIHPAAIAALQKLDPLPSAYIQGLLAFILSVAAAALMRSVKLTRWLV